jgi:hypothetical protein
LQNEAEPRSGVKTQELPLTNDEHWPERTSPWHWPTFPAGHFAQLCSSQSTSHPVLWLHAEVTKGATHEKSPRSSTKSNMNGARQAAHDGFDDFSNVMNASHPAVCAPPVQADCPFVKSDDEQTFCSAGTFVLTAAPQVP